MRSAHRNGKEPPMRALLDLRTVSLVASIVGLVMCLCMLYVSRTRKTYPGFNYWTGASLAYFIGLILVGLRHALPDLMTIVLSNAFVGAAMWLVPAGVAIFTGLAHRMWVYALPVAVLTVGSAYFTYSEPIIGARIVLVSGMLSASSFYSIFLIRRHVPVFLESSNRLLEVFLAVDGLWSLFRGVYTLFFEIHISDFMTASIVQSVSLVVSSGSFTAICFGLCVLNFQRVEHDLEIARDEVKTLRGMIPICSSCKSIRDDTGYWRRVETYVADHSEAEFTHSICPDCIKKLYPECDE
jgi:hypothetical protein